MGFCDKPTVWISPQAPQKEYWNMYIGTATSGLEHDVIRPAALPRCRYSALGPDAETCSCLGRHCVGLSDPSRMGHQAMKSPEPNLI